MPGPVWWLFALAGVLYATAWLGDDVARIVRRGWRRGLYQARFAWAQIAFHAKLAWSLRGAWNLAHILDLAVVVDWVPASPSIRIDEKFAAVLQSKIDETEYFTREKTYDAVQTWLADTYGRAALVGFLDWRIQPNTIQLQPTGPGPDENGVREFGQKH